MTEGMKQALKGSGGGLQSISSSVGEFMSSSGVDTRGGEQKKADEASSDLHSMGKSSGPTVEGTGVSGSDQIKNQSAGTADHLDMGSRKT